MEEVEAEQTLDQPGHDGLLVSRRLQSLLTIKCHNSTDLSREKRNPNFTGSSFVPVLLDLAAGAKPSEIFMTGTMAHKNLVLSQKTLMSLELALNSLFGLFWHPKWPA